jgi:hypothetical protein
VAISCDPRVSGGHLFRWHPSEIEAVVTAAVIFDSVLMVTI